MRRRWADSPEAAVEDMYHYTQSLLDVRAGQRKSIIEEDVQCTKVVRRTNKGLEARVKNRVSWKFIRIGPVLEL